jgi:hypothetical protein
MNDADGSIDRKLRDAGEAWRSTHPVESAQVDPAVFATAHAPRNSRRLVAAFAGAATLVVAGVLLVVSLPRAHDIAFGSPRPSATVAVSVAPSPSVRESTSPAPTQTAAILTPDQAVAAVTTFVRDPALTDDLEVSGPMEGDPAPFYGVFGRNIDANVSAVDGSVLTLLYLGVSRPGRPTVDIERAKQIAQDFVSEHPVPIDGLDREAAFADYGDTSAYLVTWVKHEGAATAPVSREIDVDGASGRVYRYVSVDTPYARPPTPQISQRAAEDVAVRAADASARATIGRSELLITFADTGAQLLVWRVSLNIGVTDHAIVDVDAVTGDPSILYSSKLPASFSP